MQAVAGLACLCATLLGGPAQALPAEEPDPVTRLLADRGLIPPMRDAHANPAPNTAAPSTRSAGPAAGGVVDQARDRASDMVISAMNFLGVPYRRGGDDANGFDCSGFTRHIFEHSLGLVLPRRADEQASASGLVTIGREELRPGDLVFFNTLRRTFSHVGIYIGDGKFIHAPRSGGRVRIEDMQMSYWQTRFTGARRASLQADAAR